PLPGHAGCVPDFLEQLRQRHLGPAHVDQMTALRRSASVGFGNPVVYAGADGIATCEQTYARRRTDRGGRVEAGETNALGSQAIEVRRANDRVPVTGQIAITEVVSQDDDHVRLARCRRSPHCPQDEKRPESAEGTARVWNQWSHRSLASCAILPMIPPWPSIRSAAGYFNVVVQAW